MQSRKLCTIYKYKYIYLSLSLKGNFLPENGQECLHLSPEKVGRERVSRPKGQADTAIGQGLWGHGFEAQGSLSHLVYSPN